ncbi:MAG: OFA family MFS transporter [Acidobacteria bacterium]|nr:OFA family MFS transporter [Acidobacteriota bacterium]
MNRWFSVLGGLLMNLSLGSLYGWSLFVPSLQKDLSLSREQASNIFSLAIVVFALCFLGAGRLQDKKGPYIVSIIGSVLVGAGFLLSSRAVSLNEMYWTFGVVVGAGCGFGYVTPIGVASKWFPDRRGLVIGLMVAGFGGGSAILGPVVPGLIADHGWRNVLLVLGGIYFVATMIGAQFLKNPPAGWKPAGWTPTPQAAAAAARDFSPAQVVGTSQFWRMLAGYALGTSAGLMVISQVAPFVRGAVPGIGAALAGTALLVGAVGNAGGRIFSGWMSDHFGRVRTLCFMVMLSAVVVPLLGRMNALVLLWPALVVVYYCFGTQLSLYASLTADFFGTRNVGANYGLVFLAYGIAGIIGPKLGGGIFDRYRSYTPAFDLAAGLLVLAFLTIATLRAPARAST